MYNPLKASAPFPVSTGDAPNCRIGRRSIHVLIDFSMGTTYQLDLSQIQSQGQIDSVQTLYIDNSANLGTITVAMQGATQQNITLPPNSQAYLPVLQSNPPVINFSVASGAPVVNVQLLNFFLPPLVWSTSATGGQVIDLTLAGILINSMVPVITAPNNVALTDGSGTITTGGTVQPLFAANPTRKKLIISNPSTATEVLQFMFGAATAGRITLAIGANYISGDVTMENNSVFIVAATTGHAFTAYQG